MRALVATFLFRALLSGLLLPAVGFAGPSAQTATGQDLVWDREIALLAANQADAGTAAEQLVELARNAKRTETLRALHVSRVTLRECAVRVMPRLTFRVSVFPCFCGLRS